MSHVACCVLQDLTCECIDMLECMVDLKKQIEGYLRFHLSIIEAAQAYMQRLYMFRQMSICLNTWARNESTGVAIAQGSHRPQRLVLGHATKVKK